MSGDSGGRQLNRRYGEADGLRRRFSKNGNPDTFLDPGVEARGERPATRKLATVTRR